MPEGKCVHVIKGNPPSGLPRPEFVLEFYDAYRERLYVKIDRTPIDSFDVYVNGIKVAEVFDQPRYGGRDDPERDTH